MMSLIMHMMPGQLTLPSTAHEGQLQYLGVDGTPATHQQASSGMLGS